MDMDTRNSKSELRRELGAYNKKKEKKTTEK
jgi:hypothetical protein